MRDFCYLTLKPLHVKFENNLLGVETPQNIHGGDRVHWRSRDLVHIILAIFQLTCGQKFGASLIFGIGSVGVKRLVLVTNKIRRFLNVKITGLG